MKPPLADRLRDLLDDWRDDLRLDELRLSTGRNAAVLHAQVDIQRQHVRELAALLEEPT